MKILESAQMQFLTLGICFGTNSNQKHSFNSRNVFILILLCIGTISTCVDLFYTPKNFREYTISAYAVSAMVITTICFLGMIWQTQPMSKYLDCFEKTINKSKFAFTQLSNFNFITRRKNICHFRTNVFYFSKVVHTNQSHSGIGM